MVTRRFIPYNEYTVPLSKSGVQTYDRCPHRFKLSVIDQEPADTDQPQLTLGIFYHDIVDKALDYLRENIDHVKDELSLRSTLNAVWDEALYNEKFQNWVDFMVTLYHALENKRLIVPAANEYYMEDRDPSIMYTGTVDAIFEQDDGTFVIVDWKSGKYHGWALRDYRFELAGYRHLAMTTKIVDPKKITHWAMFYMADSYVHYEEVKARSVTAFYARVKRTRERIRAGTFQRKIGKMCQWCPYTGICFSDEDLPF